MIRVARRVLAGLSILGLTTLLAACGGGGGGGTSATATADFTGTWSGSYNGTNFSYLVTQSGNNLSITRTTPVSTGLTYSGTVTGNSAVVTTYGNGVSMGTSTLTKLTNTTGTLVLNSCVAVPGFVCGAPNGTSITLTNVTASSGLSFPLQTGYKAVVASGLTKSFTVSGTCTGTGNKSSAPANTAATFEGVNGFSAAATLTMSLTNCTPASIAQTYTSYFDTNYVQLGFNSVGVNYGVFLTPPAIPVSVTVGWTGVVGTMTMYTDSTKATGNGREDLSYVVEADTATTAVVDLIAKIYNAAGTLTATEQDRYRIDSVGTLTPVSIDIQYANGSTTHLVLTF